MAGFAAVGAVDFDGAPLAPFPPCFLEPKVNGADEFDSAAMAVRTLHEIPQFASTFDGKENLRGNFGPFPIQISAS